MAYKSRIRKKRENKSLKKRYRFKTVKRRRYTKQLKQSGGSGGSNRLKDIIQNVIVMIVMLEKCIV